MTDTPTPNTSNVRRWIDFEIRFDFAATEAEAAEIAEKHLNATGVFVHEIQVRVPGIEKIAGGVGTVYTWSFLADVEFEPIEQALLVLPPTYIGPRS